MRLYVSPRPPPHGPTATAEHEYLSVHELVASTDPAEETITIEAASWESALDSARTVRAAPHLTRLPVHLLERPPGREPEAAFELFDAIGPLHRELQERLDQILIEAERLAHRATSPSEAVAQYLACRPRVKLRPIRDWRAPGYYAYPVVEALLGDAEDAFTWLDRWAQRHVLEVEALVDRVRLCEACASAHLSYLDVCPACGSLDIASKKMLHCFTCGHVGPHESFMQQERLRCPKCEVVLRHIGVDYDRPLQQEQCRKCSYLFVDAEVRGVCMACGAANAPERLPARAIAIYRLGEAGALLARQGSSVPVFAGMSLVNYVAPDLFERLIEWQVALARRHPETHFFSVIGVRAKNLESLVGVLGRSQTGALIDTFADRLREILRVTDITTRTEEHLWLLAPRASAADAEMLIRRIVSLARATRQKDGHKLEFTTTACTIPGKDPIAIAGDQILGVLASRLS